MNNSELRALKEQLGVPLEKIWYKSGVRLPYLEAFFSGKSEELDYKDRQKIEAVLEAEKKRK